VSLAEYQRLSGRRPCKVRQGNGVRQDSAAGSSAEVLPESRSSWLRRQDHPNIPALALIRSFENCARTYVEDVTKQDMINFMGWLRAFIHTPLLLTQKEPAKSGLRARPYNASRAKADAKLPTFTDERIRGFLRKNLRIFANC